jgi:hypothetical protein
VSKEKEARLAEELFGRQQQPERAQGGLQAIFPGLSWEKFVGDVVHESKEKLEQGTHEMAAALFNGSAFVMYPRGTRDDHGKDGHGVHGPEQGQGEHSFTEKQQQERQEQDRGGREM